MAERAGVFDEGWHNIRWVSIANEPNSTTLQLSQYEAMYRALGIGDDIGLMGGDLVQNTEGRANGHRSWFDHMVQHTNECSTRGRSTSTGTGISHSAWKSGRGTSRT